MCMKKNHAIEAQMKNSTEVSYNCYWREKNDKSQN